MSFFEVNLVLGFIGFKLDPSFILVNAGFLSLEEIDEADYDLQIPKPDKGNPEKQLNSKKQKHGDDNEDVVDGVDDESGEEIDEEKDVKNEKKKKRLVTIGKI